MTESKANMPSAWTTAKNLRIPVSFFGPELKEGDVFDISLTPRPDLKKERSDEIGSLLERLRKKGERKQ